MFLLFPKARKSIIHFVRCVKLGRMDVHMDDHPWRVAILSATGEDRGARDGGRERERFTGERDRERERERERESAIHVYRRAQISQFVHGKCVIKIYDFPTL